MLSDTLCGSICIQGKERARESSSVVRREFPLIILPNVDCSLSRNRIQFDDIWNDPLRMWAESNSCDRSRVVRGIEQERRHRHRPRESVRGAVVPLWKDRLSLDRSEPVSVGEDHRRRRPIHKRRIPSRVAHLKRNETITSPRSSVDWPGPKNLR